MFLGYGHKMTNSQYKLVISKCFYMYIKVHYQVSFQIYNHAYGEIGSQFGSM